MKRDNCDRAVEFDWTCPATDREYRVTAVVRAGDGGVEDLEVRSLSGHDLTADEWKRYEQRIADACYEAAHAEWVADRERAWEAREDR